MELKQSKICISTSLMLKYFDNQLLNTNAQKIKKKVFKIFNLLYSASFLSS